MNSLQKVYEELVSLRREGKIDEMERLLGGDSAADGELPGRSEALLILSLAAIDDGQFERALRYSHEMLLTRGVDTDIASGLAARTLILMGRSEEAEALLRPRLAERSQAASSETLGTRIILAEAGLARGETEEAKRTLEVGLAAHNSTEDPPALALAHGWFVLAKTEAELGHHSAAVAGLRQAIRYARSAHQHLFAEMAVTAMASSLLAQASSQ